MRINGKDLRHEENINDKLVNRLLDLHRMMRKLYEGKASQSRILIILFENGGHMPQKELTECLRIQPGSASEILTKLESAGLVTRIQSKEDRRATEIELTEEGRAGAVEAVRQRRERHKQMFASLNDAEQTQLLSYLERLCADWDTHLMPFGKKTSRRPAASDENKEEA